MALLEEIKITNLDIRERGVEETGAMQKFVIAIIRIILVKTQRCLFRKKG